MLKQTLDKISIAVPNNKKDLRPIARVAKLAEENDRSVSYLAVEAILEYLKQEENKTE